MHLQTLVVAATLVLGKTGSYSCLKNWTKYEGQIIARTSASASGTCASACHRKPGCLYFSFDPIHKTCDLLSTLSRVGPSHCHQSGAMSCYFPNGEPETHHCIRGGVILTGAVVRRANTISPEICVENCTWTPNCRYITWNHSTHQCTLLRSSQSERAASLYSSASMQCFGNATAPK
ncbi:MAG: uncharacterized protein KVP18_001846 [Porospora cf. gigantea A]|uniref:uncharacterized protein n=1 Tax=Porospora cf. gigantea A TaxID=2853593 RepID=UPI003559FADA|nr:MAG: hypothetical protein KVP18_001846 [Porospora cf. gigantea A]